MISPAAVVLCALELLGRSEAVAPIRFLPAPPRTASPNAEAFIVREPPTIYLITSTEAFRNAQRGFGERNARDGCRKIASVIVHEEWHLQHGRDEQGAYEAQLTTLAAVGAPSIMFTTVRQSMAAAVAAQKRQRPDSLVAANGSVR